MTIYYDSGVLVKLYVREPNSAAAARLVCRHPFVDITPVHELEIRNTLRALEGRTVITASQRAVSEHMLDRDIVAGRLRHAVPDWSAVFRTALDLSRDFTTETLARSLDIIHVAIAIARSARILVTADARQAALGRRAGLTVEMVE